MKNPTLNASSIPQVKWDAPLVATDVTPVHHQDNETFWLYYDE